MEWRIPEHAYTTVAVMPSLYSDTPKPFERTRNTRIAIETLEWCDAGDTEGDGFKNKRER